LTIIFSTFFFYSALIQQQEMTMKIIKTASARKENKKKLKAGQVA
jgi:hypothetical protein